jgi:CBS domain-containing protein
MTKLREIMRPGFVVAVPRDATIADAARAMIDRNVGMVAVLDGDRLVGLFSERDVVRRIVGPGRDPRETTVGEVMTTEIVTASPDTLYTDAIALMDGSNIRHLPIVEDGRLLSMLSIRDLLRVELRHKGEEIRYLQEYLLQGQPEAARA